MRSKVTRAANESCHALMHRILHGVRTLDPPLHAIACEIGRVGMLLNVITLHRADYARSMAFRHTRR